MGAVASVLLPWYAGVMNINVIIPHLVYFTKQLCIVLNTPHHDHAQIRGFQVISCGSGANVKSSFARERRAECFTTLLGFSLCTYSFPHNCKASDSQPIILFRHICQAFVTFIQ